MCNKNFKVNEGNFSKVLDSDCKHGNTDVRSKDKIPNVDYEDTIINI